MSDVLSKFLNKENIDETKKALHKALELGIDFKLRDEVINFKDFDECFKTFNEPFPQGGMELNDLLDDINVNLLPHSINFASPYSMAFPDAGNSQAGLVAVIISNLLNQNLINWLPCAPVATVIEIIVLNWLRELVGYSVIDNPTSPMDAGGFVTTGGVSSNTIAQLLARESIYPDAMTKGLAECKNIVSIVPNGIDHYSSRLAMGWLGLGESNVIKAPTKNFKYDLPELEKLLDDLDKNGKKVMSLIAYAGDSRSMTCDNFFELRKLCDKYGIWFHVDGCHGTQLLFSDTLRSKLNGVNLADSITFDPHKVMNVPYVISILLVKDQKKLSLIQRPEDIITGESHSFGQFTPLFGTRAFLSLKLYMLFKHIGVKALGQMIDRRHEMALLLGEKIEANEKLILVNKKIDINSVVFMYLPEAFRGSSGAMLQSQIDFMNSINQKIQETLLKTGKVWLHNFLIPDLGNVCGAGEKAILRPLRFMSGNPLITESHIDEMLNLVVEFGSKIERQCKV